MAITKEVKQDKIEIVTDWKHLQIREQTTIKEDGVVISQSFTNRYVLTCGRVDDSDNFIDTDISSESDEVKGIANLLWTDAVKASWKAHCIANKPGA
tara:strand:+ start:209 stop:499 length:291 start_codon:yes stop_codon:yes gene_type:complete